MKVYNITLKNNQSFLVESDLEINIDDYVIIEDEKGLEYGKITKIIDNPKLNKDFPKVIRIATKKDEDVYLNNLKDAREASDKCKAIAKKLNLEMHVVNAYFNFERTQLLINFTADDRIDFRELVKELASIYHTRIELRQIGARDKAKQVSGLGVCGQKLCCSSFLKELDSVSMNKAKNQNLVLNPSKINGACGRLLCCLTYEDDEYTRCNKGLQTVGTVIKIDGKEATITGVDILSRTYRVLIDDEKRTVKHEDIYHDSKK